MSDFEFSGVSIILTIAMISCPDSDSDNAEEEFFTALALLKSTKQDSEVKLRNMLLASIAKRKNISDIEMTALPQSVYLRRTEDLDSNAVKRDHENSQDPSAEIPRISIPDEECSDSSACKICGGAKIGPFILLECQDCQDAYHPLCHQPPVTDIDVYDPRLVWRCEKCDQTSEKTNLSRCSTSLGCNKVKTSRLDRTDINMNKENLRKYSGKIKSYFDHSKRYESKESLREGVRSSSKICKSRVGSILSVSHSKSC